MEETEHFSRDKPVITNHEKENIINFSSAKLVLGRYAEFFNDCQEL